MTFWFGGFIRRSWKAALQAGAADDGLGFLNSAGIKAL